MIKKVFSIVLLVLCFKFSFAQNMHSDIGIFNVYADKSANLISLNDTAKYYLVKFKDPGTINLKKILPVKRISYNFYVVKGYSSLQLDSNIINVSAANDLWKASDNLLLLWQKHAGSKKEINIKLTVENTAVVPEIERYGQVSPHGGNSITIITLFRYLPAILNQHGIVFADIVRKAHSELAINDIDLAVNNISAISSNYPGTDGTGINVSVKEDLFDKNDLDLLGRSFSSFQASSLLSEHATTMATLIGGSGNSFIKGLGTAPMVKFTSSTFANLFPDSTALFKNFGINIQNHSYGTGIENFYSDESLAYDQQALDDDSLVHIFSAGNIGTSAPATGLYTGIAGVANITGTFKQAKNVLVIGGTDVTSNPESLSSSGPAYDGRIVPQLVADGEDGTSGAAALVSGTVSLLQQAYKKQYNQPPSSALIKCVLINSADDIGAANVDYKTGYGKLNALEAIRTINENRFEKGAVANQQQMDFTFVVPAGCTKFKTSLAWNDVPAVINAPTALVNNLDFSVTTPGGLVVLPWALSSFPKIDSLVKPAQRKRDTLNNTQQVTLANPAAGTYTMHVRGSKVAIGAQTFYVAQQAVVANTFEWTYPSGPDHLFAADSNYVRWQNSYPTTVGALSVSYDHGVTWKFITNVTLKNNYYNWIPPDVFTTAILKMVINGQTQMSREFVISKPINVQVGYNCTSGTLLHWKPQPGNAGYIVYNIKDNLLHKLTATADTTIIIAAQQQSSVYFAVSALGKGFEGLKSYTINVANQGVGCYIRTLLANVSGKNIVVTLSLGSVLNLKSVTWEKLTGPNQYTLLFTTNITGAGLTLQYTDTHPKAGIQYYRAKLITTDNTTVYTDVASATFLQASQFAVFPNPVSTQVTILSGDINNYEFKLYSANGRLRLNQSLNELSNTIPINLEPGVYAYVIILNNSIVFKGKLVKI